jgi:ribonucleotide reductase beta subunit family protein with ferritin-like domain
MIPPNIIISTDPAIDKFTADQLAIFWLPDEINVDKDIQDMRVNLTPAEYHGVTTTLKLFTLYEVFAGRDFWGEIVQNLFIDKPEIVEMSATFAMFELAIHKRFYQKINELLALHTEEFYNEYTQDAELAHHIKTIQNILECTNNVTKLVLFAFLEGAVLYSSFAFLKHFQSSGKNKLANIVRGINFSVRDENLHCLATVYLLKKHKNRFEPFNTEDVHAMCQALLAQETYIIEQVFAVGEISGITKEQCIHFFSERLNHVCELLGITKAVPNLPTSDIGIWFYAGINGYTANDQFTGVGNQYHRKWSPEDFTYSTY